ncbi:MAG: InlB B-repeat-containing protein, partial [Clostridia bacterium]|nr:InlB B-repeat-containing protein [Clostridia bacterium]
MRYWPTGKSSTCEVDLKASQCFGFARYCQWIVYGYHDASSGSKFTDVTGTITNCTGSKLKSKLIDCAPATHVRTLETKKGWGHSIVIISTSDYGVNIADANNNGYCKVRYATYSWDQLATWVNEYGGIDYANSSKSITHVHDYVAEGYEQAHPHKVFRKCACGDWYYTGATKTLDTCLTCNPTTLKVYFNANGGSISSDTYKLSSNLIYNKSDSSKYYQKWTYNNTKENGLVNASTFGIYKTGYTFNGWGTKTSGGTVFDQGDNTLKPTDINANIKNGDCSTTLYAQWVANSYKIAFNGNGATSGSMSNLAMTYGTAKNLTANTFVKTGYTFNGWNTKADGSGTAYANKVSVKNLTSAKGGTITLYAQWKANSYKIAFNGNGATSGSMSNLAMTYGTAKNLTANAFAKTGYTFNGWNTKADGSGTAYANKVSVKNLTSAKGGTITLYAQWKANSY